MSPMTGDQGRPDVLDDAGGRAPEIVRKGALRHSGQLSGGHTAWHPDLADKYYNMSQEDGDASGPWNFGEQWAVGDDRKF